MGIIIALISIVAIALLAWTVRSVFRKNICPICVGTAATWLWMLIGMWSDVLPVTSYQLPVTILMGGSVVGIAYQLEKRLRMRVSPVVWKITFIPAGFAIAYALVTQELVWSAALLVALLGMVGWFMWFPKDHSQGEPKQIKEIEEKMKNCC